MSEPWHCGWIPNGDSPLVVCEKDDLKREIEEWRERCLVAEGLLVSLYRAGFIPDRTDDWEASDLKAVTLPDDQEQLMLWLWKQPY